MLSVDINAKVALGFDGFTDHQGKLHIAVGSRCAREVARAPGRGIQHEKGVSLEKVRNASSEMHPVVNNTLAP